MNYLMIVIDAFNVESETTFDTLKEAQFYCKRLQESNENLKSLELVTRVKKELIKKYV